MSIVFVFKYVLFPVVLGLKLKHHGFAMEKRNERRPTSLRNQEWMNTIVKHWKLEQNEHLKNSEERLENSSNSEGQFHTNKPYESSCLFINIDKYDSIVQSDIDQYIDKLGFHRSSLDSRRQNGKHNRVNIFSDRKRSYSRKQAYDAFKTLLNIPKESDVNRERKYIYSRIKADEGRFESVIPDTNRLRRASTRTPYHGVLVPSKFRTSLSYIKRPDGDFRRWGFNGRITTRKRIVNDVSEFARQRKRISCTGYMLELHEDCENFYPPPGKRRLENKLLLQILY